MNWMTALTALGMCSNAGGAVVKPPETPVASRPAIIHRTHAGKAHEHQALKKEVKKAASAAP
ncbi:hypothetical protein [Crenobacter cavernae]|nr:hypothetical protein [Crenobacter cavernae]